MIDKPIDESVPIAVERFKKKFGVDPEFLMVHPAAANGLRNDNGKDKKVHGMTLIESNKQHSRLLLLATNQEDFYR